MKSPELLPEPFRQAPFRVSDAIDAGVSPGRLRRTDLVRPAWGVRALRPDETLLDRCGSLAVRLPAEAVYSHSTAAMLLGAPLPARVERDSVLHVTVARGRRAVDAEGIVGHQLTMSPSDVTEFQGLRMTTPARTWCDLASLLRLDELVAVGDYLIRRGTPLATSGELHSAAIRQVSRIGRQKRMTALPLLSDRAESAAESRLRVLLVLAGFDDLLVNEPVYDDAGRFLARPDLRMRRAPVIVEYEGDYHRTDRAQWMKDISRVERLQSHGWHVVRVTADDLAHPQALLFRLKRVLAQLSPGQLRTSAASLPGIAAEVRK